MKSVAIMSLMFAVACGGAHGTIPLDSSDGQDGSNLGPNLVLLDVTDPDAFVSYRDGTSANWRTPLRNNSGQYELHVTLDYEWVCVCANDFGFDAELHGSTVADGPSQLAHCLRSQPPANTVAVSGHMVQAGTIWLGDTASSSTSDWTFLLDVPIGIHALVAIANNRILVQRNNTITAPAALPSVDITNGGVAMNPQALTINNLGADVLTTHASWALVNDGLQYDGVDIVGTSATVELPPASVVMPGDLQLMEIDATNGSVLRTASTESLATTTTFNLMPALSGVTFNLVNANLASSWSTLPNLTELELELLTAAARQRVVVSQSWLDVTKATTLQFDPIPADYNPAWMVSLSGPYVRRLIAKQLSTDVIYWSAIQEAVNGATLPRRAQSLPTTKSGIRPDAIAGRRSGLY